MKFRDNWHIQAICEHLEAVSRGEIRRLLINIPPGHAKSLLVAVLWPAWVWTWRPTWRGIFCSYADDLVVRDSVRSRDLMGSEWYQENFVRGQWKFSDAQNRKDMFTNTRMGMRMTVSVGSKATGFRANTIVCDDPLNAKDAPSKLKRDECIYWWDKVMSTRVNDPANDQFVVIMQRLHEDDLSGHLLSGGDYEHLCLPTEFDGRRRSRTFVTKQGIKTPFFEDPRKTDGELLFPSLFPPEVIADLKKPVAGLGADAFSGQHNQLPQAPEGGLFKYGAWRFWTYEGRRPGTAPRPRLCDQGAAKVVPKFTQIVGSLDAAFKGTDSSDYVVFTVWGCAGAERYLIDLVRGRFDFTQTQQQFLTLAKKHPTCRRWLVEDKANGPAIINSLKTLIMGLTEVNPEGGKEARAFAVSPFVDARQVYLPDGCQWVQDFVDELAVFPRGKHDDQVDSVTQALNYLATSQDVQRALMLTANF